MSESIEYWAIDDNKTVRKIEPTLGDEYNDTVVWDNSAWQLTIFIVFCPVATESSRFKLEIYTDGKNPPSYSGRYEVRKYVRFFKEFAAARAHYDSDEFSKIMQQIANVNGYHDDYDSPTSIELKFEKILASKGSNEETYLYGPYPFRIS